MALFRTPDFDCVEIHPRNPTETTRYPDYIEKDGVTYAVDNRHPSPSPLPGGCEQMVRDDGKFVSLTPVERPATPEEAAAAVRSLDDAFLAMRVNHYRAILEAGGCGNAGWDYMEREKCIAQIEVLHETREILGLPFLEEGKLDFSSDIGPKWL